MELLTAPNRARIDDGDERIDVIREGNRMRAVYRHGDDDRTAFIEVRAGSGRNDPDRKLLRAVVNGDVTAAHALLEEFREGVVR